jgi:N6-adenosine-specific RNA methylase IME4
LPDGVTIKMVGLGGIAVSDHRLRKLRPEVVEELAESILQQGLLQPIRLRPRSRGGSGYILVAGRHRLEAVRSIHKRKLGPDNIRAEIVDDTNADAALLAEIDENLVRADLSPAERAMHVDARKTLYEKQHTETKHGGAPGKAGGGKKAKDLNLRSFVKDTAKKTGKGRSTVAREATRGKGGRGWLEDVAGTSLDKGDEIDALIELSRLSDKERGKRIREAQAGEKVSAKTALKQYKRVQREQELRVKILALPEKKYGVILEDYEWDHETWSDSGKNRHASNHYPTSTGAHTAEEIVARTRDRFECAADDCALWMWTTVPHQAIAFDVMRLRGFVYKSQVAWDKEIPGTGHWFINQHEVLLLGIRGNVPAPAPGTQWPSIIRERKREHSRKPEKSYQLIEAYFPNTPRIELNCRGAPRPNWDAWGVEAETGSCRLAVGS